MTPRGVAVLLLVSVATACGGSARTDPPVEEVSVTSVADGDTVTLVDGRVVRLDGINAPERGECLAREATDELARLVAGGIEIAAAGEDRYGRVLAELVAKGRSVNEAMVVRGLAISTAIGRDPDRMREAEHEAREARAGMWDPEACGSGPVPPVEIVGVDADPPGPDGEDGSDENVVLAHAGEGSVDLSGWVLRDESSVHRFVFPEGTVLAEGASLVVSSRCRSERRDVLAWCSGPVWNNDGDTAFLLEPDGRIVAWYRFAR